MLGEVVKFIMIILNFFIKPRIVPVIKDKPEVEKQQLQKNPRYKSSNGF
jgi:hypothetical protein